jgi:hypothetical protein
MQVAKPRKRKPVISRKTSMVMTVMLLLGATLTAQANFIPARKSPTDFYAATAICDKKLVRPLTREQPVYTKCMLGFGWRYIYIPPD